MPAYTKTVWVNGTTPAINATNLNKIEQGIADAVRKDGSEAMSAQLVTIAGSAATPAIAPTGDSNTGIFFPAADTIAFGEGGAEAMRITSSGNLGIGTTVSADIIGQLTTSKLSTSPAQTAIAITGALSSGTSGHAILWKQHTTYTTGYITCDAVGSGAGTGLIFATTNAYGTADATEKMRIMNTGNVGIGTTAPARLLEISSSTNTYQRLTSTINAVCGFEFYTNSVNQALITGDSNGVGISTISSTPIVFKTNSTEKMRITSDGNVGIGVNPNVELHVKGTGEIFRLETTAATGDNFIRFYAPSATTKGFLGYTSSGSNNLVMNNVLSADVWIGTNNIDRLYVEAGGTTRPATNNTYDLGSATYRWATIYAQNALNTSDARLKTDVAPSSLGLDFINQLNPVQYRWIEGGNTVEKVQTGTETVEITPAIPAQPEVLDEDGNVIKEATQEVPAITEDRPIYETVVTSREGVRTHFGLIAQEVKAALPDGLDFAGWCLADKDDLNSTQSLGYTQLIAPMIKAIQELNAKVAALEAQLNGN